MGATEFSCRAKGKTAAEAFNAAVEEAQYQDGHGGYTGTIAEKPGFRMIEVPDHATAEEHVDDCFNDDNHWIQDKWGDAGCVDLEDGSYVFFGWASS